MEVIIKGKDKMITTIESLKVGDKVHDIARKGNTWTVTTVDLDPAGSYWCVFTDDSNIEDALEMSMEPYDEVDKVETLSLEN